MADILPTMHREILQLIQVSEAHIASAPLFHSCEFFLVKRYNFSSTFTSAPRRKQAKKSGTGCQSPEEERSVPEPAAPSSCHRGDAPGSAGPRSSAKTPTQPSQEGQHSWLSWLPPEHVRLGDKGSVKPSV